MAETSKSFIKKFVGFSLVTWISFVITFLTAPIYTRLYLPDVLGKINIFNIYSNLFGIFILLGLDHAFARFYLERPNNKSIGYLFTFCFGITYAFLSILFILSVPISSFLSLQLFEERDNLLLYLFFLSVFCSATLRYLNLSYRMEKNIKMYTIQGILMTLVSKVLYMGVGFWDASYKPALVALTISHVILAAVFLLIQGGRFEKINGYDKYFASEMFKYALPLVPVSILYWANNSIPQIVMQKTMDYYSIGIFSSAVSLAHVIFVIQAGFNTFWVPYVYENYKTHTGQFFKVHRYLVCALTLFALLLVLSQDVVFLILGEKYRAAKSFFPFLILGPVCYIIGETTGMGINISKKTYWNIVVFGASVLVNIVFCILLSLPLKVPGIAIATAIAAITAMMLKTYIGERCYRIITNYRYMYISILLILLCACITLFIPTAELKFCLLSIIFLFSLFFFKLEIKELCSIVRSFVRHDSSSRI